LVILGDQNYYTEYTTIFMFPFQTLISIDKNTAFPAYKQLANRLITLIQEGRILPGSFLPSTREFADMLQVNRKTITRAYEELISQNWLEGIPKKGFRIIPDLPLIRPRSFDPRKKKKLKESASEKIAAQAIAQDINLPFVPPEHHLMKSTDIVVNDGFPDANLLPFEELFRAYRRQLNSKKIIQQMALRDDGGLPQLKKSVSGFLNETRGLNISTEEIVMTRGAQMAIYIAATLLLKPGDLVAVTDPNYPFANDVIKQCGAQLIQFPVDADGLDIDLLTEALKKKPIRLLYLVPHHHHPTTVTLSASRRLKLLQLIKEYDLWVIEDDYDYDFHFKSSPILPLASSDHDGKIIYIGSFTKLLATPFRIGYLIAAPAFVRDAIRLRRIIDLRGDALMEQTLTDMINNGELSRHIKKSNKLYMQRCNYLCGLLEERLGNAVSFKKPPGGMAVWLVFNEKINLPELIKKASLSGVYLAGYAYYQKGNENHNGIRFGFASLTEPQMDRAIDVISKLVGENF